MKILADAALPALELFFPKPFDLTLFDSPEQVPSKLTNHDILLCRSTLAVNQKLLSKNHIQCVATATSGTDHIDMHYLAKHNIPLFDAKGCNAKAVGDYVIATVAWLKKHKQVQLNQVGIIGLGQVGTHVAKRLQAAKLDIITYDPPKSLVNNEFHSCTLGDLTKCDLICIHADLNTNLPYPSKNLLNSEFFAELNTGCVIINASRGGIVNESALLKTNNALAYCTDVYLGEPNIDKHVVDFAALCTPHIAGHSIEAKYSAVEKISEQLHHYYKLPKVKHALTPSIKPSIKLNPHQTWEDNVLALYNPFQESQFLKEAANKMEAFLLLRKAHKNRHAFTVYDVSEIDKQTQIILGHLSIDN